jgi:hypothetical protein
MINSNNLSQKKNVVYNDYKAGGQRLPKPSGGTLEDLRRKAYPHLYNTDGSRKG